MIKHLWKLSTDFPRSGRRGWNILWLMPYSLDCIGSQQTLCQDTWLMISEGQMMKILWKMSLPVTWSRFMVMMLKPNKSSHWKNSASSWPQKAWLLHPQTKAVLFLVLEDCARARGQVHLGPNWVD
jgi:hypothetical protein